MTSDSQMVLQQCAELFADADGLLITAGAGMGVDSGLPDFRGTDGFWRAYPALGRARLPFERIANPQAFRDRPALAWGFYGHRLKLYRETTPHAGFQILQALANTLPHGAFVFTSNVDGQFQAAGFAESRIAECHGSIHHLQCIDDCSGATWPASDFHPEVDADACLLRNEPPRCPHCGGLARPNVLMFGDWDWQGARSEQQERRLETWLSCVGRGAVMELGAGQAIPTVRMASEDTGWPIVRINPREAELAPGRGVSLGLGALAGLQGIASALGLKRRGAAANDPEDAIG